MSELEGLTQIIATDNDVTASVTSTIRLLDSNTLFIETLNLLQEVISKSENVTNVLNSDFSFRQVLYVNASTGTISIKDILSGKSTIIIQNLFTIKAIALSPDGNTLYVSVLNTDILAYYLDPLTNSWKKKPGFLYKSSEDVYPGGLLVIGNYLYITNTKINANCINVIDATTGNILLNSVNNFINYPIACDFNVPTLMVSDGTYIYISNTGMFNSGSNISRMNIDGSNLKIDWVTGLLGPTQMVINDSSLYVVNGPFLQNDNTVVQIDIKNKDAPVIIGPLRNSEGKVMSFDKSIGLFIENNNLNVIDNAGNILFNIFL